MSAFLAFLIPAAVIATAIVLIIGLGGFAGGGNFNKKYGNNTKANQHQHRVEEEEHGTKHHCDSKKVAKNDQYSLRENL